MSGVIEGLLASYPTIHQKEEGRAPEMRKWPEPGTRGPKESPPFSESGGRVLLYAEN